MASTLTYQRNGATRTLPQGFSWTTFLFGAWPSAFRCHWSLHWTIQLAEVVALVVVLSMLLESASFSPLVIAFATRLFFAYNRNHMLNEFYLADGWTLPQASDEEDETETDQPPRPYLYPVK